MLLILFKFLIFFVLLKKTRWVRLVYLLGYCSRAPIFWIRKKGRSPCFFSFYLAFFFAKGDFFSVPFFRTFFFCSHFFSKGLFCALFYCKFHDFTDFMLVPRLFFFFNICPWAAMLFFCWDHLFFCQRARFCGALFPFFLSSPWFAIP